MKVISIALALIAASATQVFAAPAAAPEAAPVAEADAGYHTGGSWCFHPGQPCYMMKRTIDAFEEVKRSAEAMADAMAKE